MEQKVIILATISFVAGLLLLCSIKEISEFCEQRSPAQANGKEGLALGSPPGSVPR